VRTARSPFFRRGVEYACALCDASSGPRRWWCAVRGPNAGRLTYYCPRHANANAVPLREGQELVRLAR
jgi:hypothetical protein